MVTDEERREAARRLRGLPDDPSEVVREWAEGGVFVGGPDQADYYQIHEAVLGCLPAVHMHPGDYRELHERLADLIEPGRGGHGEGR